MDETEVQVEIACWAQDHPEASSINWDNEPWVDFSGRRCTLHLGLGGLTWSIEVPTGYQTEIDARDGKRKRLWEPLDYGDTVIVQSRSTPFRVSVVDRSNNILELFNGLGQEGAKTAGARSRDEVQLQKVNDMFKTLRVESNPRSMPEEGKALVLGNAYLEALKGAETLAEVLDSIHGLAKLYNKRNLSLRTECSDPDHDADGPFLEDVDDERMFDIDFTMKWSSIAAQVNYAREACAEAAAARYLSLREWVDSNGGSDKVSKEDVRGLPVFSPSCSGGTSGVVFHLENLTLASPPGDEHVRGASSDTDDEYTFLYQRSLASSTDICENSNPQPVDHNASGLKITEDVFRYESDSDKSDSSWEIPGFCNRTAKSNRETSRDGEAGDSVFDTRSSSELSKVQQTSFSSRIAAQSQLEVMWPWDPATKRGRAKSWQGSDHDLSSKRMKLERSSRNLKELQWCDIAFNPVSFSVECTLRLREFMDNHIIATALGFSLEHPLRLEIVPNKAQVDSLAWTGAVEVYVSQHSDWHNHISEEICGLLCLVPDIVQRYFHDNVPTFIRNNSVLSTTDPNGDLFVGLMQTLVRRLTNVNTGGSCCVCGKPGDRPTSLHMRGKRLWPCSDNLCRATYTAWQEVSSVDSQEREREEDLQLFQMEETLRTSFSYADREALKSALEVYGVNADNLNYGQRIKALARIELWNQKDPDTFVLSYPVYDIGV